MNCEGGLRLPSLFIVGLDGELGSQKTSLNARQKPPDLRPIPDENSNRRSAGVCCVRLGRIAERWRLDASGQRSLIVISNLLGTPLESVGFIIHMPSIQMVSGW